MLTHWRATIILDAFSFFIEAFSPFPANCIFYALNYISTKVMSNV